MGIKKMSISSDSKINRNFLNLYFQTCKTLVVLTNQLHWVLDVVFNEDSARKGIRNSVENFNIILKTALTLINKENTLKKSKNNKRFKALVNKEYREKVLGF